MSISSVTDADYSTVIEDCRSHLAFGTQPSADDLRLIIAVVKNATSRLSAAVAQLDATSAAIAVLDAAACAANAGADAAAVIADEVTDLDAASTAAGAATYITNTLADG